MSVLKRELNQVPKFSRNSLLYNRGLIPIDSSFDSNSGSFIAFNQHTNQGCALWVKDGQLFSPIPAIIDSSIDKLYTAIAHNTEPLRPIGLISIDEED